MRLEFVVFGTNFKQELIRLRSLKVRGAFFLSNAEQYLKLQKKETTSLGYSLYSNSLTM